MPVWLQPILDAVESFNASLPKGDATPALNAEPPGLKSEIYDLKSEICNLNSATRTLNP
jgi:hypothetical protein